MENDFLVKSETSLKFDPEVSDADEKKKDRNGPMHSDF